MKTILTIITLTMAVNIFAWDDYRSLTPESSWDEINKARNVKVVYPMVQVKGLGLFVTFDQFCHDDEMLRTGRTYKKCMRWEYYGRDDENRRCKRYETFPIQTPRKYTETKCVRWEERGSNDDTYCAEYRTFERFHPTTKKAAVYHVRELSDDTRYDELFEKEFSLPACK